MEFVEALYRTHRPWLVQWCTAMTGNPAAAEDLAQDTFLRALEHSGELEDLSTGQVRAWLRKTAKNRYIDLVRRAKGQPEPEADLFYLDDHSKPMVAALCAQLPEEEGRLFTLRYFQGYNATELGELFDLKPSTVRARLASARRKLKLLYETP